MRHRLVWALCIVGILLARHARAQVARGPEFAVNADTTGFQDFAAIASDAGGNFVVVWHGTAQDGDGYGVFGRKFQASGTPVGAADFRANVYTTGAQRFPSVASDAAGDFVVAWASDGQDGDQGGIFARRFDASGTPGPEFRVNTYTTGNQFNPKVAMNPSGSFVVTWQSPQDGDGAGIYAQRYDATGVAQGAEFRVNSTTAGYQDYPSVGMDLAGNFVVVWMSPASGGVVGQRFDAAGSAQGGEFLLNSTTGGKSVPSIGVVKDGSFVAIWRSDLQDGSSSGVFARRFDPSGAALGPEFQVNVYTTDYQGSARVAVGPAGGFLVTWESLGQDGSDGGIFARAYDAAGVPAGDEFQVNAFTTGRQWSPTVARQPFEQFVLAWGSAGQDGDGDGIIGRRFATDLIYRDGFESGDLSRWSSTALDGGDLFPTIAGALDSTTVGLEGDVDDTASLYVQDDTPLAESEYRARFYLDTNGFDPGEAGGAHRVRTLVAFAESPQRRVAAIVLKRLGGVYSIEGRARLDDDSQADTGFFDVTDGPHSVELHLRQSTGVDANDGSFELWIDGTLRSSLTLLDNSLSGVDFVRMGALSVKTGASGTLFWDEFESRRMSYIGN